MRLKNCFASEIDFLKSDCVKLLAKNAEKVLSKDDFDKFIDKLIYMVDILTDNQLDSYFAKK